MDGKTEERKGGNVRQIFIKCRKQTKRMQLATFESRIQGKKRDHMRQRKLFYIDKRLILQRSYMRHAIT